MFLSRGDMASLTYSLVLFITINFVALSHAGPLGPLPNVTGADLGLKEGSCALGDVVYMPGDEFPGTNLCEKCACRDGSVKCSNEICEPRPGCKALHRPDHCCPTYQCECEQEGRVYGNGEKLVDPADPCRVCYCQGGEVVCRRIACFVRDDCTPRLVPGRCCPEYDNCPLRGVTNLPGISSIGPSMSTRENGESAPAPPKENIKQEITIKEITPVSEIPVITEVKIKEILPSPSIEVAEYSSSKSPLIPREATSEKNVKEADTKTESPSVVEVHLPSAVSSPESVQLTNTENKDADAHPSKISFSTQDSIHSSIYPSNVKIIATMGVAPVTSEPLPVATTKAPIIEDDDTFDHNPAFPPLPDDLAVLRNHEDEIVPEVVVDNEHVPSHDGVISSSLPSTETELKEPLPTTKDILDTSTTTTTTESPRTTPDATTIMQPVITISTQAPSFKESPMVNLRSAIPTEILNVPSLVSEEVSGTPADKITVTDISTSTLAAISTTAAPKSEEIVPEKSETPSEVKETTTEVKPTFAEGITTPPELLTTLAETRSTSAEVARTVADISTTSVEVRSTPAEVNTTPTEVKTTPAEIRSATIDSSTTAVEARTTSAEINTSSEVTTPTSETVSTTERPIENESEASTKEQEQTTNSIAKSNVATEVTSQTELSSLPIETSDQNPPEVSEQTTSDKAVPSTIDPLPSSTKIPFTSSEVITVSRAGSSENVETTEFILTPFGSSETATDAVELIKISADPEKSAAIIESEGGTKNNALTDLIKLVSDVASISDHTEEPAVAQVTTVTSISDSEELIPINAGYKSKNKNFNQNSITEIPFKNKITSTGTKQKVVEIEDDESEGVTDSLPPNDKVEPTTRRPIIDNVSDDGNVANNKTTKKDIEIISQSYVPTISRRPTKVVMKKSKEKPASASDEVVSVSTSTEVITDSSSPNETPLTTSLETSASADASVMAVTSVPVEPVSSSAEHTGSTPSQPSTSFETSATTERSTEAQ